MNNPKVDIALIVGAILLFIVMFVMGLEQEEDFKPVQPPCAVTEEGICQ
jgi:hypothetical protein